MRYARLLAALAGITLVAACQDHPVGNSPEPPQPPAEAGSQLQGGVRTGWIMDGGKPVQVRFEVRGGRGIYQGDIDLGPADAIPTSREALLRIKGPRYGVVTNTNRWSSPVNYTISSSFNSTQQQVIKDAIAHISSNAKGVVFHAGTASNYIHFTPNSTECSSPVGRQGGKQEIQLTSDCAYSMGTVVHEILHALGFWHEQSRCDRDTRVEILWGNIEDGKSYNFDKKCSGTTDVRSYDEGSIMHYRSTAWGKIVNGVRLQTIRSLYGLEGSMGQRSGLSSTDVSTLDYLFNPPPPPSIEGPTYPPYRSLETYRIKNDGASLQSANWYRDRVLVATTIDYVACTGTGTFELLVDFTDVYGRTFQAYKMVYPDPNLASPYQC